MESLNYILVLILSGIPSAIAICWLSYLRYYRKRNFSYFTRVLIILLIELLISKFLWEFFMVYY